MTVENSPSERPVRQPRGNADSKRVRREAREGCRCRVGSTFMCETVPLVVAGPRRRPRARLLRGAPPPRARCIHPARVVVAPRVAPPRVVPLPHRDRRQRRPNRDTSDARGPTTRAMVAAFMATTRARARCGGATRAGRRMCPPNRPSPCAYRSPS